MDHAITLDDAVAQVRSFHRRIQAPVAEQPVLLVGHPGKALGATVLVGRLADELLRSADGEKDIVLCRAAMVLEELSEWLLAHANSDLVAAADAIGDRLYLLLGDAAATGLPLQDIFQAIHRSNMSKMSTVRTGVGKAVKGTDFRRPEIAAILSRFEHPNR